MIAEETLGATMDWNAMKGVGIAARAITLSRGVFGATEGSKWTTALETVPNAQTTHTVRTACCVSTIQLLSFVLNISQQETDASCATTICWFHLITSADSARMERES